jgi:hypothetical protein
MTKAAMSKKKTPFTSKFGHKFKEENRKVTHLEHIFV